MSKPKDGIEDAEVVSETPADGASSADAVPEADGDEGGARAEAEVTGASADARPDTDAADPRGADDASEAGSLPDAEDDEAGGGTSSVETPAPSDEGGTADAGFGEAEAEAERAGGREAARSAPIATVPPAAEGRSGGAGALMLVLGGLVAAGIGWLAATYLQDGPDIEALLAERDAEIAALRADLGRIEAVEGRLDALPEAPADRGPEIDTLAERLAAIESREVPAPPDLSPVEQALVAAAQADEALAGRLDEIAATLPERDAALGERLDALEARIDGLSIAEVEGGVEPEAVASLRSDLQSAVTRLDALSARVESMPEGVGAELDALREETTARADALSADLNALQEGMAADAQAREDALRADLAALQEEITAREAAIEAERARLEEEARQAASDQARGAAIASLRAALDTGEGFEAAAATLAEQGVELPPVLSENAAEGIPTLAALQQEFPPLARSAIASAPAAEDAGAAGFLRRQLGVRSLEAREGDDADAVLSRAEAALREGDLDTALAEMEALDEGTRAALDDWSARARLRAEARAAADTLAQ